MRTILRSISAGWRRLWSHKRFLFWLYFANLALALIPAFLVFSAIQESVDHSQMAEGLRQGFSDEWHREFRAEAGGFAETFTPAVTGIGAVLDGLDAWLSGKIFNQYAPILGLGVLLLLMWTFATGGVLNCYLGREHREPFWASCGRYFGPLVRLLLLAALFYLVAYRLLLPWVDQAVQTVNRQNIDERVAFAWVLAKYSLVLVYIFLVNLLFDYAKIVCVAEARRSALSSALAAVRLILRRPIAVIGLYAVLGVIGVFLIAAYALVAPGALQDTYLEIALAFLAGQLFIVSRVFMRLYYFASQSELYMLLAGAEAES